MFKLQIVLIPPRALDLQVPNYPVVSTPNNSILLPSNSNGRLESSIANSKQIAWSFNNNITNTNASVINYNSASTLNGKMSTTSNYSTPMTAHQRNLKHWRLKLIQTIAFRNQLFQNQCKKFLLFINLQSDLYQLAKEISLKFKDMYPNFNEDLNIITIQDNNGNDLDPDYIIKDVFNTNNIVNVLIDKDVDWNNPKYLETKYTRFSKRRKLNLNKYSNNNSNNTIHVPIHMLRAPEAYRDSDPVILDNTINQTTSHPSSKIQSSSSISTPEISHSKLKNMNDKKIDKNGKEFELYGQSSPRETLLGTPVMSIVTPGKLTNSQQKIFSNNTFLTETVRYHGSTEIETETASNITLPLKTPTIKSNFSNPISNGISVTTNGTSKTTMTPLDPSININILSSNKKLKSTEMKNTTTGSRTINYSSRNKEFKFERPSALSKAKIASLKRQQSTIANDSGSPIKNGQSSKDLSENVHLAELPSKPTNILNLGGKLLENNNGSKSIFEKIREHQESTNLTSTANNNINNVTINKCQEKTTTQKPQKRQITHHNTYDSNKSVEKNYLKSKEEKQKSKTRLSNINKGPNDKQQKSDNKDSANTKVSFTGNYEDEVKDKDSLKDKSDTFRDDPKTKHTATIESSRNTTITSTKIKSQSIGEIDTNPASKLQQERNKDLTKSNTFFEYPKHNIEPNKYLSKQNDALYPLSSDRTTEKNSSNSKTSRTNKPKDGELKVENVNKSQKEHSQSLNNNRIVKENQITKTTNQTSHIPDTFNNLESIHTKRISEESQAFSDKTSSTKYQSVPKLAHKEQKEQKESIISEKTSDRTSNFEVATKSKSFNKKANHKISSRNSSFEDVELSKMFGNDKIKTPPWLSKNQNSTTQMVIGKTKERSNHAVLNKDIDNSKLDPRNILPARTLRNAARKASLKLARQIAALRSSDSDNSFNEIEGFENRSGNEEKYESTSSSGVMTDISSEEEVMANSKKVTQNIAVSRHDLKESIVSSDVADTNNTTSNNSKQTQTQSNKNHDISNISVCKTNNNNNDNKLVIVSSRHENILNETKNSFSNKQNIGIKKIGIKHNKSINGMDSKSYQSPSYLKLSQSNQTKIQNSSILSNEPDETNSPGRSTKYFSNKPLSKYSNRAVTISVSTKKGNDVEATTFMNYLKHPEVGEDILLDLDFSDSEAHKISIISSNSNDTSIEEERKVQSALESSENILTTEENVHTLPSPHKSSGNTSILNSLHSKSISVDHHSSPKFVANTSTNISNRLQRINSINLVGTKTTGLMEVTSLVYGSKNSGIQEELAETSSESETSSVEMYE